MLHRTVPILCKCHADLCLCYQNNEHVQVELVKPLGLRFARGSDGGAYVTKSDPNLGDTDTMVQVCELLDTDLIVLMRSFTEFYIVMG